MSRTLRKKILAGIAQANFWTFIAGSFWLGGDALAGKANNGHYFLSSHGRYTEVSYSIFLYSYIHAVLFWMMVPLILWAAYREKKRRKAGEAKPLP